MTVPKTLTDYVKRGPFDEIDTPFSAVDYLIPSLRKLAKFDGSFMREPVIWESAPPRDRPSLLANHLEQRGFSVIAFSGIDYFQGAPDRDSFDVIVTNPPFSLKEPWVTRTMSFGKPWALLLPITALGCRRSNLNVYLSECQIILPPRRVDFVGKKRPWQYVAWYTWGFNLPGGNLIPVDDDGQPLEHKSYLDSDQSDSMIVASETIR
ncbi:hypothetical protein LCGC14_0491140 [marine sediment metagenome]|uniref:Uncharacterized protein n=1 Tax=marine sediment metagenome TaxID=412755 RepID=A0A0F9UTI4_9ZZZZ